MYHIQRPIQRAPAWLAPMLLGMVSVVAAGLPAEASAEAGHDGAPPFDLVLLKTLDPQIEHPHGIARDGQDRLYVAGDAGVKVFDAQDQPLRTIKTGGPAVCVAFDSQGNLYAAQRAAIEKFDPEGRLVKAWGKKGKAPGEFQYITSLAVAGDFLYVADAGARRILRFAVDGDFVDQIDGFIIPSGYFDLAIGPDGALYAGHTGRWRIERYDRNNKLTTFWGEWGDAPQNFCGCCNPTNLAFFSDGRVATTEKGFPRLKVYDKAGKLLAFLGPEAFPPEAAGMDLAVDSKGRLALLEPVSGLIHFYELKPDGKTVGAPAAMPAETSVKAGASAKGGAQ